MFHTYDSVLYLRGVLYNICKNITSCKRTTYDLARIHSLNNTGVGMYKCLHIYTLKWIKYRHKS